MPKVNIRGDGVAASCSAYLLERAGFQVSIEHANRVKQPAIMVGERTQSLMEDVFDRQGLFADCAHVRRRVVAWGASSDPVSLPHSAVVVSEADLLARLHPAVAPCGPGNCEWTIIASAANSPKHAFGSRTAIASTVKLQAAALQDACWVESLEQGWLFLLPGWLLAVGGATDSLLGKSRLVAGQIAGITATLGSFPCHPQIAHPLALPGWLACGSAALIFDPLCGDGSGNAVREAILAAAVVRAAHAGADPRSLASHYGARLLAGFAKHLEVCQRFYETGHHGDWWDEQLAATQDGLEWCAQRLRETASPFKYRLDGFELKAIA